MHRLTRLLALITLSVGAGLFASRAIGWLERSRCGRAGGRWQPVLEVCVPPPGTAYTPLIDSSAERLAVALVAAMLTLVVWGTYLRIRRGVFTRPRQLD